MAKKIVFLGFIILIILGVIFAKSIRRGFQKDNLNVEKSKENSQPVIEDKVILEKMSSINEEEDKQEADKSDETIKEEILVDEKNTPLLY